MTREEKVQLLLQGGTKGIRSEAWRLKEEMQGLLWAKENTSQNPAEQKWETDIHLLDAAYSKRKKGLKSSRYAAPHKKV